MKIAEYNQMMAYLTRPKVRDVDFGLGDTNVESLVPDSKENFKYTPISKKKNRAVSYTHLTLPTTPYV